ncbi:MAG: hypothetical protein ACI9OJ_000121 [Myxococcota bacterium]|jgi:hypothetical protein
MFAVNWGETGPIVEDYIVRTGLSEPVLLDNPALAPTCQTVPEGELALYNYFDDRVGAPEDGPFPLHVVIDGDGRIAYASRVHRPASVVATLRALLANQ